MSKVKTSFFCQNCGYETVKWAGQCPSCNQWNTLVEELTQKDNSKNNNTWKDYNDKKRISKTIALSEIKSSEEKRLPTSDVELNRVLGGGIVPGSLVLVAGEPGIGKSTLFLQNGLWLKDVSVLYISGEESEQQIKMRADRINKNAPAGSAANFYLLTETSTQIIFQEIKKLKPQLVIIDSIQTLHTSFIDSSPGSVSQIRECAAEFQRFAKETNTPVFLIGHITKDGSIAGPKILEHMVDTVLQFEGDRHYAYRILRTLKNRFGSTNELGIYEMTDEGMRGVLNPSEILITQKEDQLSGIAIAATIEGLRPLLIEVQALVTQSVYGTPQRTVSGFDLRRLQLLLAVLLLFVDDEQANAPAKPLEHGSPNGDNREFSHFAASNVTPQRQDGFSTVEVKVTRGDLTPEQFRGLAALMRDHTGGYARTTVHQNLLLRWVRDESVYDVWSQLKELDLGEAGAHQITDVVSCPGTDSCKLGITSSMGLNAAVQERLEQMEIDDGLTRKIHVKMSGCPNGCSQHHIANIGFYGAAMKVGGRQLPAYIAHLGGNYEGGEVVMGKRLKARIPAKRVPDAVERWVRHYEANRTEGEEFNPFVERVGTDEFEALVKDLAMPVEFGPEHITHFMDWNRKGLYEVVRGEGECAV